MNVSDGILGFVYIEALRDATLRGAYGGDKSKFINILEFQELKEAISGFVDNVLDGSFLDQYDYDREFLELAKTVCREIAIKTGDDEFTFGNAQKLLNMMLKYFFIATYGQSKAEREKFRFCHCPMDGMMIDVVWRVKRKQEQEQERHDELRDIIKCNYNEFHKSWGNEDFKDGCYPKRYEEFQRAVRHLCEGKDLFPIEYDFCKWNESKFYSNDTNPGNGNESK